MEDDYDSEYDKEDSVNPFGNRSNMFRNDPDLMAKQYELEKQVDYLKDQLKEMQKKELK